MLYITLYIKNEFNEKALCINHIMSSIICELCNKDFKKLPLLRQHQKSKYSCIPRSDIMKMKEDILRIRDILNEREEDITYLIEEMEMLRETIENANKQVKDKDVIINKKDDELKEKDTEITLLLNTIDNKNDTIQMLMSTGTGNTINNTNITNNTVNNNGIQVTLRLGYASSHRSGFADASLRLATLDYGRIQLSAAMLIFHIIFFDEKVTIHF